MARENTLKGTNHANRNYNRWAQRPAAERAAARDLAARAAVEALTAEREPKATGRVVMHGGKPLQLPPGW